MNAVILFLTSFPPLETRRRFAGVGWLLTLIGGVLMLGAPYLPWAYSSDALDDMTYLGGPSGLQFFFLGIAVLVVASAIAGRLTGQMGDRKSVV